MFQNRPFKDPSAPGLPPGSPHFGGFGGPSARAVGLGIGPADDTDTVAAMTGALVGAFAGTAAIPPALLAKLEDGPPKGRTHIASLAAKLYEVRSSDNPPRGS